MDISIVYQELRKSEPKTIAIHPREYFDPIQSNENYWEHGIPKYPLAENYLPLPSSSVKWFILTETQGELSRVSRYQLLDGASSVMAHFIDECENEKIVTASLIAPDTWHNVRMIKPKKGNWSTLLNEISSDLEIDGIYPSQSLIKNWSRSEAIEFANDASVAL